jgi:hypothetical protein
MRRLALAAIALTAGGTLHAATLQDNVGAGLGTLLFDGHDGIISQILASTTNGICANQTFAITSGTSGAEKPDSWFARREQLQKFVNDNMDSLAADIATGEGETIDTVAELLEVPADHRAEFSSGLQANFGVIYPDATVTSETVTESLITIAHS